MARRHSRKAPARTLSPKATVADSCTDSPRHDCREPQSTLTTYRSHTPYPSCLILEVTFALHADVAGQLLDLYEQSCKGGPTVSCPSGARSASSGSRAE